MSVFVVRESENAGAGLPDDRGNVPVSETTERFFRALLVRVPLHRIQEVHLFSPLRQGVVETGIAVVAAELAEEAEKAEEPRTAETVHSAELSELTGAAQNAEVIQTADTAHDAERAESTHGTAGHDESPYADEPLVAAAEQEPAPVPRVRHTVYTARYRLVVKGPERGRWEMDVVDEADAPLLAIESVVRGVQRRAGEETSTVRYDAGQLARALRIVPAPRP